MILSLSRAIFRKANPNAFKRFSLAPFHLVTVKRPKQFNSKLNSRCSKGMDILQNFRNWLQLYLPRTNAIHEDYAWPRAVFRAARPERLLRRRHESMLLVVVYQ